MRNIKLKIKKTLLSNDLTRKISIKLLAMYRFLVGGRRRYRLELLRAVTSQARHHSYISYTNHNQIHTDELLSQCVDSKAFRKQPKISILIPTYNTDPEMLQECLDSVYAQTYTNWEICIADDASKNSETLETIKRNLKKGKVKAKFREKNGHICQTSNDALVLATGDYIALLDHDDVLEPNALYEVVKAINKNKDLKLIYSDEDKLEVDGCTRNDPFFKPDWSPDYLRTINYITHFAVIEHKLMKKIKGFKLGVEGAQDWDLFLRATHEIKDSQIYHIPKILYAWRKSPASTALNPTSKNYAYVSQRKALEDDLKNRRLDGEVRETSNLGHWYVSYKADSDSKVSVVIPTKDKANLLSDCVDSVQKNNHQNYEVIIVDTGSQENKTHQLYESYKDNEKISIVNFTKDEFNFSAACNEGAKHAKGSHLLFLNNDTKAIDANWIEEMLGYSQRPEVGAVGAKLLFEDSRIQHSGIILGLNGDESVNENIAGHVFAGWPDTAEDYMKTLYSDAVRNYSAVTAACLMVDKKKFNKVEGFDTAFRIAYNDVDFCLKLQDAGFHNVYNPAAKLYHYESESLGKYDGDQRDQTVFKKETILIKERWGGLLLNDPKFNANLRLTSPFIDIKSGKVEPS
jgi:glycosyltransferase involved in cell wall biosynthesis